MNRNKMGMWLRGQFYLFIYFIIFIITLVGTPILLVTYYQGALDFRSSCGLNVPIDI